MIALSDLIGVATEGDGPGAAEAEPPGAESSESFQQFLRRRSFHLEDIFSRARARRRTAEYAQARIRRDGGRD